MTSLNHLRFGDRYDLFHETSSALDMSRQLAEGAGLIPPDGVDVPMGEMVALCLGLGMTPLAAAFALHTLRVLVSDAWSGQCCPAYRALLFKVSESGRRQCALF